MLKKMLRFSIIVPIYNTCSFLDRCLYSIEQQTYPNFEVILIDDASSDDSAFVSLNYVNRDTRFRLFKNETNKGNGYSRNLGIKQSKGDWVCFVDSDDYIEKSYLETIVYKIRESSCELLTFDYYVIRKNRRRKVLVSEIVPNEISLDKFLSQNYGENQFAAWRYVCKRSLLKDNNISFDESRRAFEDIIFTTQLFYFAQNIDVVCQPLYNYVVRNGSIIQTKNKRKIEDKIVALLSVKAFLMQQNDFESHKEGYSLLFLMEGFWSSSIMYVKICSHKDENEYKWLREIAESHFIQNLKLELLTVKNVMGTLMFKLSLRLCKCSFRMYILWLRILSIIGLL